MSGLPGLSRFAGPHLIVDPPVAGGVLVAARRSSTTARSGEFQCAPTSRVSSPSRCVRSDDSPAGATRPIDGSFRRVS